MTTMIGILLINLGTPEAPTESAVRKYLDVFLSDPYVITLPKILRDILVKKIILPKRSKISAQAYQPIWTEAGSPLLVNCLNLQNALQKKLGHAYLVSLGMRYGNPCIDHAIEFLQQHNCHKIILLPLFPQFSRATTQSALEIVHVILEKKKLNFEIKIIHDFYNQDFYIHPFSNIIQQSINKNNSNFILFSYHGLPKRQQGTNEYREQCLATTKLITEKLNLSVEKYQTTFQSRFGFTKWIEPYTDFVVKDLPKKGIKKLSVVCPSFVVDCVETLEEINIRLRKQWMQLGGESFELIPCLNANKYWVEELAAFLKKI